MPRLIPTAHHPPAQAVDESWPLVLNTGRVRDQWHTMTRTGRVPRLMTHHGEALLDLHPLDAKRLGLVAGDLARVESRHGAGVLPLRLSPDQRPGEIFIPMHWTDQFSSAGPVGRLVDGAVDPVSGQPELKATPVRIAPVAVFWRGLLLRRTEQPPEGGPYYWARVPLARGHALDLAGWEPLPSGNGTDVWLAGLLGTADDAELVIYADPGRGIFRYASVVGDHLEACLFLARRAAELPSRDAVASLLGMPITPVGRLALLSGSTKVADTGRTICACFGVGLRALYAAITEQRLTSIAEIGQALRAGTNCGSCIPELTAILRDTRIESASAA